MSYRKSIPKITVGKYTGTPIDQLPNSYLRWMMTQDFPKEWLEIAKKKLKESKWSDDYLNVSRHALDMYSLRFLDRWVKYNHLREEKDQIGVATFVTNEAQRAWNEGIDTSKHRHQDDGVGREFEGIQWVFGINPTFPDYKDVITVMPVDK